MAVILEDKLNPKNRIAVGAFEGALLISIADYKGGYASIPLSLDACKELIIAIAREAGIRG